MKQTAESIVDILKDYHNYIGFQFTPNHVLSWAEQFDSNDRAFVLEEFLHILNQGTYVSEKKARVVLIDLMVSLSNKLGYGDTLEFIKNTEILNLQQEGKSQKMLLRILDEELIKKFGVGLAISGKNSRRHIVYIDDILATGGTAFTDLRNWLSQTDQNGIINLENLKKGKVKVHVLLFCCHNGNTVLWRLKLDLKSDAVLKQIEIIQYYEVQNHLGFVNQRYNFTYPIADQPITVIHYFQALPDDSTKNADKAFRDPNLPVNETFFSSPSNRIRFENILLSKGVELLNQAKELKPNHRPLGAGFPSHRTLGTGTLFFTWRNISNTCPIVFWWESPAWKPLFPLKGRGLQIQ